MNKKWSTAVSILTVLSLLAIQANAAERMLSAEVSSDADNDDESGGYLSDEKKKYEEANKPFWLGLGIWFGGGANIQKKAGPVSNVGDLGVAPFSDGAGGMAGGGGAYVQTRWLKGHLGLTVGVWNERNRTWTEMDVEEPDGSMISGNRFRYYYSVVRIPIMVEALILKKNHRITFGLGPEFATGYSSAKVEVVSDAESLAGRTNNRVKHHRDVLGAFSVGWGARFKDWVIGLQLKSAYNFTQPSEYSKRVSARSEGFEVAGSHTFDIRLIASLMWEIGFPR